MVTKKQILFFEYELSGLKSAQEKELREEINQYESNSLLNTSTDDLINYFYSKYYIEPIKILYEEICADQKEVRIDVSQESLRDIRDRSKPFYISGTEIILEVPFTGESDLFRCRPSTYRLNSPRGRIDNNILYLSIQTTEHDEQKIKKQFDKELSEIKSYINQINSDIIPWNETLPATAKNHIEFRKNKLLKDKGLLASLGFPLKKRKDEITTFVAPNVRRKIIPQKPSANSQPYKPEPALDMENYEHILKVIQNTALMLERSPQTFKNMGEENLRDQFLVPLNSHYEGQVTGETFNANGKTDIIIKVEDKNIFIAECKIWRGQKEFLNAIDQLLGYTTWRDTKTALIIFNRNKDLSKILSKIPKCVKKHTNFKRVLLEQGETNFRYIFGNSQDMNRELILTILFFDLPK